MLKDLDSAEDSDSDRIIAIYKIHSQLTDKKTMDPFKWPSLLNLSDFSNFKFFWNQKKLRAFKEGIVWRL